MKNLIIDLFGEYTPYVFEGTEDIYTTDGALIGTNVTSIVHPDFEWIAGVLGFFLCFYCVLRIIGSFFNRR